MGNVLSLFILSFIFVYHNNDLIKLVLISVADPEFGLDSIDAAELVFSFETEFKIQIDPTVLWEFPTITKLSDYLVNKMGEMHE